MGNDFNKGISILQSQKDRLKNEYISTKEKRDVLTEEMKSIRYKERQIDKKIKLLSDVRQEMYKGVVKHG